MQFSCVDEYLVIHRCRSRIKARVEFGQQVWNGLGCLRSHVTTTGCDMFCHSTHGEIEYLPALDGIPWSVIDELTAQETVVHDAWVWQKAQLRVDFRYIRNGGLFWDHRGEERRWRSRWGRVIPSHAQNVFAVRDRFVANAYPAVTQY